MTYALNFFTFFNPSLLSFLLFVDILSNIKSLSIWVCVKRVISWLELNDLVTDTPWVSVISPSTTCSWINIPINQSELRDNFSGNICFRLTIKVRCFYTLVNQLSFHTDFRNRLWVGLGVGVGIGLNLYFWTVMLIQEHVLLRKIIGWWPFVLYCALCLIQLNWVWNGTDNWDTSPPPPPKAAQNFEKGPQTPICILS